MRKYFPDGYLPAQKPGDRPIVFEFLGCRWHGHFFANDSRCQASCGGRPLLHQHEEMAKKFEATATKIEWYKQQGYQVVLIWECEWKALKKSNPQIKQFVAANLTVKRIKNHPLGSKDPIFTQNTLIERIQSGDLFGVAMVDIRLPRSKRPRFDKFPPIFVNRNIDRGDIGPFMRDFAVANDLLRQPRRSLVSVHEARRILLPTPLLRWYLANGLEILQIYYVIQYKPKRWLEAVGNEIIEHRRAADIDESLLPVAELEKLKGKNID